MSNTFYKPLLAFFVSIYTFNANAFDRDREASASSSLWQLLSPSQQENPFPFTPQHSNSFSRVERASSNSSTKGKEEQSDSFLPFVFPLSSYLRENPTSPEEVNSNLISPPPSLWDSFHTLSNGGNAQQSNLWASDWFSNSFAENNNLSSFYKVATPYQLEAVKLVLSKIFDEVPSQQNTLILTPGRSCLLYYFAALALQNSSNPGNLTNMEFLNPFFSGKPKVAKPGKNYEHKGESFKEKVLLTSEKIESYKNYLESLHLNEKSLNLAEKIHIVDFCSSGRGMLSFSNVLCLIAKKFYGISDLHHKIILRPILSTCSLSPEKLKRWKEASLEWKEIDLRLENVQIIEAIYNFSSTIGQSLGVKFPLKHWATPNYITQQLTRNSQALEYKRDVELKKEIEFFVSNNKIL